MIKPINSCIIILFPALRPLQKAFHWCDRMVGIMDQNKNNLAGRGKLFRKPVDCRGELEKLLILAV